ncbi:serine proteinase inhibitor [Treponema sp. R8-4-B8]
MRNKSCFILFITIFFLTYSCGLLEDNNSSFSIVKVTAKALLAPEYGEDNQTLRTAARGANDFAFRLSAALAQNAGDENFVCSPYSVWMPLAALVNATDAQHKDALLSALGAAGISHDDMNKASSRMLYDLTKLRDKEYQDEYYNPLKITNAIFVGNNVTLRKEFAQTFMDCYRGSSINVDFSSRDAVDAVNNWASKNTNGLITNLVQEFDPLTVAAIANAIYFSDRWAWEFDRNETKEKVFHAPAGDIMAWYMLRDGEDQYYYEDEKVQAILLGFKHGGGMYIVLPKSGSAKEFLSSVMTNEYFNEIQRDSDLAKGKLLLPRFSIQNDIKGLKEALKALGVPLFEKESAPLTGGLIEEDIPVWLSDAIQRAVIKVDEKGTTAAAVTVMVGDGAAGGPHPNQPFEMICDRPFVFILYEYTYDGGSQVLFTGMVNRP